MQQVRESMGGLALNGKFYSTRSSVYKALCLIVGKSRFENAVAFWEQRYPEKRNALLRNERMRALKPIIR